jgi:methylmalonyl-CoA mutase cobalamin-binding subunit
MSFVKCGLGVMMMLLGGIIALQQLVSFFPTGLLHVLSSDTSSPEGVAETLGSLTATFLIWTLAFFLIK